MVKDPQAQAERLYHQILDLLEQISAVAVDAAAAPEDEDEEFDAFDPEAFTEALIEEAGERGLPENATAQVFKAITAFAEKSAEG